MRFAAVIGDLLALNIKNAYSRIRALFWIMLNFNLILKKRQQTQKFRKSDDNYILQVFSESYLFKPKFIV